MNDDTNDTRSPSEIDDDITEKIGTFLDINHNLYMSCRESAIGFTRIASHFMTLSRMATEIAEDLGALAASGASATEEILAVEWGLNTGVAMGETMEDDNEDD